MLTAVTSQGISARRRVAISLVPGLAVGAAVGSLTQQVDVGALAGWDAAAATFLVWTWRSVWDLDERRSAEKAEREDPTQPLTDLLLVAAAVGSLAGVGVVLVTGHSDKGAALIGDLLLAVASVGVSWAVVHTTYALKYARLYYSGVDGGIDFHDENPPTYRDFAYLAFTVGMTFQVSDSEINSRVIRTTVLRHALISFLFGAIILAATINLLAGLSK